MLWGTQLRTSEDWRSGEMIWLLDVIAPSKEATSAVLMNFHKIAGEKRAHLHPITTRLVSKEALRAIKEEQ